MDRAALIDRARAYVALRRPADPITTAEADDAARRSAEAAMDMAGHPVPGADQHDGDGPARGADRSLLQLPADDCDDAVKLVA